MPRSAASANSATRLATSQGLLVLDAEQQADIDAIIAAAATLPERPLLAIVGSMSAMAQQQIARLASQRNIRLIDICQLFATPAWPQAAA